MTEGTLKHISVIVRESEETGARSSKDIGGRIGKNSEIVPVQVEVIETSNPVEVAKLKREMSLFLQAMQEVLNEADSPNDKLQLDEVELSVEITGEGEVKLFGIGGKAGSKGAINLKFKRK